MPRRAITAGTINPYNVKASNAAALQTALNFRAYGRGIDDMMANLVVAQLLQPGAHGVAVPAHLVQVAAAQAFVAHVAHRGQQDRSSNAQTWIQLFGGVHTQVEVKFIAEQVEVLLQVGDACFSEGNVVVLRQPGAEQQAPQESQPHAVFEQLTITLVRGIELFARTAADLTPLVTQLYQEQLKGLAEPQEEHDAEEHEDAERADDVAVHHLVERLLVIEGALGVVRVDFGDAIDELIVVPLPTVLSNPIVPPCFATTLCASERPCPVPLLQMPPRR